MNTCLECLPCLGRNAVDAAKRSTTDPDLRKKILSECFRALSETDYRQAPPCIARKILDIAWRYSGKAELYGEEKRRSNRLAEQLVSELPKIGEYRPDDFESRVRLAVAGNILDFGVYGELDISLAMETVKSVFRKAIPSEAVKRLREKMDSARKILYILDNCGEAVFDRVFMEPYKEKITLGVRGRDAFNDVTAQDLADCGLGGWKFVSNGAAGIPGTVLSECSDEFRREFEAADLIIAKGQGNFETMNEYPHPMAFLFLAKCPVVIRTIGAEERSIQIRLMNMK